MRNVKITECYGERVEHVSRHRTDDTGEALARAVARHWGAGAVFVKDSGTEAPDGIGYGQVGRPIPGDAGTLTMKTGRVRVEIT